MILRIRGVFPLAGWIWHLFSVLLFLPDVGTGAHHAGVARPSRALHEDWFRDWILLLPLPLVSTVGTMGFTRVGDVRPV